MSTTVSTYVASRLAFLRSDRKRETVAQLSSARLITVATPGQAPRAGKSMFGAVMLDASPREAERRTQLFDARVLPSANADIPCGVHLHLEYTNRCAHFVQRPPRTERAQLLPKALRHSFDRK